MISFGNPTKTSRYFAVPIISEGDETHVSCEVISSNGQLEVQNTSAIAKFVRLDNTITSKASEESNKILGKDVECQQLRDLFRDSCVQGFLKIQGERMSDGTYHIIVAPTTFRFYQHKCSIEWKLVAPPTPVVKKVTSEVIQEIEKEVEDQYIKVMNQKKAVERLKRLHHSGNNFEALKLYQELMDGIYVDDDQ